MYRCRYSIVDIKQQGQGTRRGRGRGRGRYDEEDYSQGCCQRGHNEKTGEEEEQGIVGESDKRRRFSRQAAGCRGVRYPRRQAAQVRIPRWWEGGCWCWCCLGCCADGPGAGQTPPPCASPVATVRSRCFQPAPHVALYAVHCAHSRDVPGGRGEPAVPIID